MLAVVMKMAKQSELVIGHQLKAWLIVGVVLLSAPVGLRAINVVAPATEADNQGVAAAPATRFSPGVADILKLVEAKVDPEVVKTFIKNSTTAYNPTATEIIALKDQGVPPEILTAMLQRGAEVRAQSMRAAAAAQPGYPQVVNPSAPVYDYGIQPAYPSYPDSSPVSAYTYPAYSYGYPGYDYGLCDYGYGWPSFISAWAGAVTGIPLIVGGGVTMAAVTTAGAIMGAVDIMGAAGFITGAADFTGIVLVLCPLWAHVVVFKAAGEFSGRSFGGGGRLEGFSGSGGGFRGGGGVGGHSASFGGRGGGGFGGHSGGRGR